MFCDGKIEVSKMEGNVASSNMYSKLRKFTESWISSLFGFLWGFAEATLFFIVPDLYLGFIALFNWRKGLQAVLWTVAGALLGGAIMYSLASNNPQATAEIVMQVPLIGPDMLQTVRDQLRSQGLFSLLSGLFAGIPYKIYAVEAGSQNQSIPEFLIMTIPARLARILPATGIAGIVGVAFRRIVKRQTIAALSLYFLFWFGIYLLYFFLITK
jgi:membrane protein DedA with SNARE-associated domain